jgi:hypothetical protein
MDWPRKVPGRGAKGKSFCAPVPAAAVLAAVSALGPLPEADRPAAGGWGDPTG